VPGGATQEHERKKYPVWIFFSKQSHAQAQSKLALPHDSSQVFITTIQSGHAQSDEWIGWVLLLLSSEGTIARWSYAIFLIRPGPRRGVTRGGNHGVDMFGNAVESDVRRREGRNAWEEGGRSWKAEGREERGKCDELWIAVLGNRSIQTRASSDDRGVSCRVSQLGYHLEQNIPLCHFVASTSLTIMLSPTSNIG